MPFVVDQKARIAEALEALSFEKRFEKITISDIVERSNITRSTFYRYFNDKYDAAIYCFFEIINRMDEQVRQDGADLSLYRSIVAALKGFEQKRDVYLKISEYRGQNSLYFSLCDFYLEQNVERIKPILGCKELDDEIIFNMKYIVAAQMYMIDDWLRSGCKESAERYGKRIVDSGKRYYETLARAYQEAGGTGLAAQCAEIAEFIFS